MASRLGLQPGATGVEDAARVRSTPAKACALVARPRPEIRCRRTARLDQVPPEPHRAVPRLARTQRNRSDVRRSHLWARCRSCATIAAEEMGYRGDEPNAYD